MLHKGSSTYTDSLARDGCPRDRRPAGPFSCTKIHKVLVEEAPNEVLPVACPQWDEPEGVFEIRDQPQDTFAPVPREPRRWRRTHAEELNDTHNRCHT